MLIVLDQKGGSLLVRRADGSRLRLEAGRPVDVLDSDAAALIEAYPAIVEAAQNAPDATETPEADTDTTTDPNGPQEPPVAPTRPAAPKPRAKPKTKSSGAISVSDLSAGGRVAEKKA